MKFELLGYKIYDDDYNYMGEIYQEDTNDPFIIKLEGQFSEQDLVDILNKLLGSNEALDD